MREWRGAQDALERPTYSAMNSAAIALTSAIAAIAVSHSTRRCRSVTARATPASCSAICATSSACRRSFSSRLTTRAASSSGVDDTGSCADGGACLVRFISSRDTSRIDGTSWTICNHGTGMRAWCLKKSSAASLPRSCSLPYRSRCGSGLALGHELRLAQVTVAVGVQRGEVIRQLAIGRRFGLAELRVGILVERVERRRRLHALVVHLVLVVASLCGEGKQRRR